MTEAENTLVTKIILDTATDEDFKAVAKQLSTLNMFLSSENILNCLIDFNLSLRRATSSYDDSIMYLHIYRSGTMDIRYNIQRKQGTYEVSRI